MPRRVVHLTSVHSGRDAEDLQQEEQDACADAGYDVVLIAQRPLVRRLQHPGIR